METALFTILGTLVGGLISYSLQDQRFKQELKIKQEEFKTEFMAERTVKHFLSDKRFKDRTFLTIKNHLGGFDDDELRKILVRSGAIRLKSNDGKEYWTLLDANDTNIENE